MTQINESHTVPTLWASRGYAHVKLLGSHAGPRPLVTQPPSRRLTRAQAKAAVKARKSEQARGVPFLTRLTEVRNQD